MEAEATAARCVRRRSVAARPARGGRARLVARAAWRLTAESALWANAGGRFGDLADAREWLTTSPRMTARKSISTMKTTLSGLRAAAAAAARPTTIDRVASYADAVVSWTLKPLFKCCTALDKMEEVQLGAVFSRVVVQFMLQIFIILSEVAGRVRTKSIAPAS